MDAKDIKKRVDRLKGDRSVVEGTWDLIRQFVVPYRGKFYEESPSEGSMDWRQNRRVFDSTAPNANNTLSSSLHGAITNPSHQWFGFRFRRDELSENREAAQWLRDCAQITFETLRDSNFNVQANEAYIDLTAFGTAFVTKEVLETPEGEFEDFLFQASPLEESFFEQDYRGRVCNYYRVMNWTAHQVVSKFGKDKVPDKIQQAYDRGNTEPEFKVIFAVYKRNGKYNAQKHASPSRREFGYKFVLYDTADQIGKEGGYHSMPGLVMRWRNTSGSMWGNSPAMLALPDILTLNQLVEMTLNSLEKVIDPAIMTTERGLMSHLDLGPAGINVVRNIDDLKAFESKARFDVAELSRENLQSSIRSIFYVDQLELKNSPAMTATEVTVRYELMQRLLGPTLGRLESDFLDPLVTSAFVDLMRYKKLPPPPDAVAKAGDPTITVQYTGPMARAQKADQANMLNSYLQSVAQIGEINPEALDKVDWDQAVALLAEYHGAEPKILKSDAVVKKDRKQRQELATRQAEATVAEQEGKAVQANAEGGVPLRSVN
jgi:Bacteriophage head to tail connecting protein